MENFTFTKAGGKWNEDRCYVCDDFGYVLDGATSLIGGVLQDKDSPAEWWSSQWDLYLREALKDNKKSIEKILKNGIKINSKKLSKLKKFKNGDFPNTTIALFRKQKDYFEFFVLGDSPLFIETRKGGVIEIENNQNIICDSIKLEIIKDSIGNNDMINARNIYKDLFLKFRNETNKYGGAYSLSNSIPALNQAIYRQVPAGIIKKIVIMSDGFAQVYDLFKIENKEMLIHGLNSEKVASRYYEKLYGLQEKDEKCNEFMRFKKRDDSTVVVFFNK